MAVGSKGLVEKASVHIRRVSDTPVYPSRFDSGSVSGITFRIAVKITRFLVRELAFTLSGWRGGCFARRELVRWVGILMIDPLNLCVLVVQFADLRWFERPAFPGD
jgi:hypothetical protein